MGARGPGLICRSASEWRRAAMGCGREVAAHALWGDTAPRHCTPFTFTFTFTFTFGDVSRPTESYAPWWAHRESWRTRGLVCLTRCGLDQPRRLRHRQWQPDARSGAHLDALWRTDEHSGAIIVNHRPSSAISSTQQQSAAISRPTPSPHAAVLGEGSAASTATDCLAIFPRCAVLSRFVIAS